MDGSSVSPWDKILGDRDSFSMENRLFSLVCFIAMVALMFFLIINLILHYWVICGLVSTLFICEVVFYWFSRVKKIYRANIIINSVLSYLALIQIYFFVGINGPVILLFFFTFHLLVAGTPNKLHPYWVGLHVLTLFGVMAAEYLAPGSIKYSYNNVGERIIDLISCYLITLVLIFIITRFLLNYYQKEKIKTEDSQFRLRAFFETSESCYVLLNRRFEITYFNHAATSFTRAAYGKDMKFGEDLKSIVNPEESAQLMEYFTNALNGLKQEGEQMVRYSALGNVWWHFTFAPVIDERKNITGVAFTSDNITDRKEQEERIKQSNDTLMKIAYVQSHELRQPVSSILGLLNLLKDDPERSYEYLPYLNDAVAELDCRLGDIIVQTKTASKID